MAGDAREAIAYEDFWIGFVGPLSGPYRVKARCGDGRATAESDFPLGPEAIDDLVPHVEAMVYGRAVARRSGWSEPPEDEEDPDTAGSALASVGREIFDAVMGGGISTFHAVQREKFGALRIRIQLDLEDPGQLALSRIPWECLKPTDDPDLAFPGVDVTSPIVRSIEQAESRIDISPIDGRLRVLVVTANPPDTADLPGLPGEEAVIGRTFAERERNGDLEYDLIENASWEDLKEHLRERRDYHVLHFMGHGGFDPEKGGVLFLHRRDERGNELDSHHASAAELAELIRGRCDRLRLVLLNACNTARETGEKRAPQGVAAAFLSQGIPAVIAMQFEVADTAAVTFARTLYRDLVTFKPLEEAVTDARLDVLTEEGGTGRRTDFWMTPVLYLLGRSGAVFERGEPPHLDPPETVDAAGDPLVWLTEWGGKLVLNWRANAPEARDIVALFDEEPSDPDAYLGVNFEPASRDGRPVAETRTYTTDKRAERDRYHVAYLREKPDGGLEIIARYGPY